MFECSLCSYVVKRRMYDEQVVDGADSQEGSRNGTRREESAGKDRLCAHVRRDALRDEIRRGLHAR